jgi:uncharacterized protein HemX
MLKRRGRWRTLLGLKGGLWYYDSDPPRKELTTFERKTLWLSVLSLLLTIASVIVAFGAFYYVFRQFREMAAQTDLLSQSLKQAKKDAEDSANTTATQLAIARQDSQLTQRSVAAFKDMLLLPNIK